MVDKRAVFFIVTSLVLFTSVFPSMAATAQIQIQPPQMPVNPYGRYFSTMINQLIECGMEYPPFVTLNGTYDARYLSCIDHVYCGLTNFNPQLNAFCNNGIGGGHTVSPPPPPPIPVNPMQSNSSATNNPDSVTVKTNELVYGRGDRFFVSGSVNPVMPGQSVSLNVYAPGAANPTYSAPNVLLDSNGNYEYVFSLPCNPGPMVGQWKVTATYIDTTKTTSFNVMSVKQFPSMPGTGGFATGVVDYGLYYGVGCQQAYSYNTTDVKGIASINQMTVTNGPLLGGVATLQLNTELATSVNGKTYYFWIQNVASFNAPLPFVGNTATIVDNVWNETVSPAPEINSSLVSGKGNPNQTCDGFSAIKCYVYTSSTIGYSLPATISLEVRADRDSSGHPTVHFFYTITSNDKTIGPVEFDTVKILQSSDSANFLVSGFYQGQSNRIASGLVLAGPSGGRTADFNAIQATLSLAELTSSGWINPVHSFDWDTNTIEGATNVHNSLILPDLASVLTNGTDAFKQLW